MGAFDTQRPPPQQLLDDCVHCGLCLPTCPTYVLWGEEMDSPRGRIVLIGEGLKPEAELSPTMTTHFDRCLGCMACVSACPSGVQYDRLIERVRPQVERHGARTPADRALRRLLFATLPHPGRLRALAPALALGRRLRIAERPALARFPRMRALAALAPVAPLHETFAQLPERRRAIGAPRGRVGLLQGCVQRVFFGGVNRATAAVLAAEGFDVLAPRLPGCCGALELHAGAEPRAIARAQATIAAFSDCDVVVANAAGCGSAMKDYGDLLESAEARAFSAKVRDVSELLADVEPRARRHPVPLRVVYHDACHLAHAQGIRAQPRALLRAIPGLELIEVASEPDVCCGSAGVYNILQPEAAHELGERKARALLAAGAQAIAAANPGCAVQIAAHLERLGQPLPITHPIELLWRSIARKG
jgi:glycolate oxidase iron-sulfur subunit